MGKREIFDEFVIHQNLLNCNKHGTKTPVLPNSDFPELFEKVGKLMPKGIPKVIVDAERNRRTLEKPASHFRWFDGGASSKSTKQVSNIASNGTKKAPK